MFVKFKCFSVIVTAPSINLHFVRAVTVSYTQLVHDFVHIHVHVICVCVYIHVGYLRRQIHYTYFQIQWRNIDFCLNYGPSHISYMSVTALLNNMYSKTSFYSPIFFLDGNGTKSETAQFKWACFLATVAKCCNVSKLGMFLSWTNYRRATMKCDSMVCRWRNWNYLAALYSLLRLVSQLPSHKKIKSVSIHCC